MEVLSRPVDHGKLPGLASFLAKGSLGRKPLAGSKGSACYSCPWFPLAVSPRTYILFLDPFPDLHVDLKMTTLI